MVIVRNVRFSARTQLWSVVTVIVMMLMMEASTLNGPNVCMVKQKYNITKRVKYRAPMSVRTYEWCMSIPPRCSKWSTEMRDLTRLETEERTAEVAVCCPGYKMKDVSCVPICPAGKTGHGCSQECPPNKWGPNCVNECQPCSDHGSCSSITGECSCQDGWQGESCESRMSSTTSTTTTTTARVEELLTKQPATKPTPHSSSTSPTTTALIETTSSRATTAVTPSTQKSTIFETASLRTTIVQQSNNDTTPMTTAVEINSNQKESKVESTKASSKTTISESSTMQTIPSATLSSTTVTRETPTSEPTVTTTIQTLKAEDTTTTKSITKEVVVKESSTEHGRTVSSLSTQPVKDANKTGTVITATTESYEQTTVYNNVTLPILTTEVFKPVIKTTQSPIHNRTDLSHETRIYPKEVHVEIKTTPVRILKTSDTVNQHKTTAVSVFTESPIVTHSATITEGTTKLETSRRPDATIRYFPTTVKFKPKEIWIRPAQKGQESFAEAKKINHDLYIRHRIATNKESVPNTTPKTIIVSIIPTSVSYATFKKIALSTASVLSQTTNMTHKLLNNSAGQGFTKPMSVLTTLAPLPSTLSTSSTSTVTQLSTSKFVNVVKSKSNEHFYKVAKTLTILPTSETASRNQTVPPSGTNSMATVTQNLNSSNSITPTVSSTNFIKTTHKPNVATAKNKDASRHLERITKPVKVVTAKPKNITLNESNDTAKTSKIDHEKTNATKIKDIANAKINKVSTESPDDEETFHILTEPEHITAVMDEKGKGRTSVDLISVISIAGGIMMAVITVAVIIVMVERCRRPRYEDVRKMNDIHMQVMIDNNDVPPPYVRSIFHTPLPDPPSDKCHYQPISTLDRNLKQFMRPVVVQTISPIMLENFRGILECHYDHLPRRSHDFEVRQKHCPKTPSSEDPEELAHLRPSSIAESTIDALKCEAKLDVLDSTTSEPLYAEIPCWRPPSEHAIEVMNYNGEAVTEL